MKAISEAHLRQAEKRANITIHVFLAGPNINPKMKLNDLDDSWGVPSKARHFIYEHLNSMERVEVILGEHNELIEAGKRHWKEAENLAITELGFVREFDCTIILPSSVGSFCEFGLFSANASICRRMLALLDANYDANPGYLHLGPAKMAQRYQSDVTSVHYEDHDGLRKKVEEFIEAVRTDKMFAKVLHDN